MADVEVTRFVEAPLEAVERLLSPRTIVEYEGTFTVDDVTETDDGWTVDASMGDADVVFDFVALSYGYAYEQRGDEGPFDEMETTVALRAAGEETRVTLASTVDMGLPLSALTDRLAGWKRRGELRRALNRLEEDLA
ncbi:MAG: SRPBCC family protein [Haloarculaceae archaeon]